jgi:hypothetical protein
LFQIDLLQKNCDALAARNPTLATAVREAPDDPAVTIETARDGALTLAIDGRQVLSKYAPRRDAERLTADEIRKQPSTHVLIVFGFELGAVARLLLQRTTALVFVVEPRLGVLRAACGASDLAEVLRHERLTIVTSVDHLFIPIEYGVGLLPDLCVLALPGMQALLPAELERLHDRVKELVRNRDLFLTTNLMKNREWFANLFGNFPAYAARPSIVALAQAFRGRPAVIVSAGPSLDRNVHLLREWKGRGVIISVGTALRKCVASGVTPDLTVALESNDILGQFRGIEEIRDGFGVFQAKCHPELWRVPARGIFYYANIHPDSGWMMRLLDQERAMLPTGGSVSTAAFSLAALMRCSPLVLIGQDLAFGAAGQSHAAGIGTGGVENLNDEQIARALRAQLDADPTLCVLDGYHGGQVVSKTNLRSYLLWFEENIPLAREAGLRVVNCTEGGAKIAAAEQMTFADATAAILGEPFDAVSALDSLCVASGTDWPRVKRQVQRTLRGLREVIECSRRAKDLSLELQQQLASPPPADRVNQALRRIEKQERRLKELMPPLNDLLSVAADQALLVLRACFDYTGLNELETLRLNMKQSATMYHALVEAAQFVQTHVEGLLPALDQFTSDENEK